MSTSQLPSKILPSATVSSPSVHPREITSLVLVINSAAAATTRIYEMKIPLHNCDGKVFTIEEGTPSIQVSHESKTERVANYFKLLKWFVAINILILLLFCGYALWSFYQLEMAMQTREGAINLNRYFKRYDANSMRKTTTIGDVKVRDIDGTVVISDFQEWQKFILSSLENLEDNVSYNLKFLLHSITSIVKNFVENDKARATDSELKLQNVSNSPTLLNNKLIMTNLTDFEIHILKEFIKLKMLENNGTERSRFSRTAESVKDESECDLHLTFVVSNDKPIRVLIKPEKTEGAINESNDLNDLPINETNKAKTQLNTMESSARESHTFTLECVILLLFTAALSLAMWTLHRVDSDMLVLSIIDNKDDTSAGTLELVDESRAVVWSQKLNEHALRRLEKLEPETLFAFAADEELTWSETSDDLAPFRRRIRSNSAEVKRIALDGARLVRCDRLKPRARGKYLTTPSLYALQACYRHGQRLDEPTTSDEQRLDLGRLYVGCEDVFGAELDELTDELRKDYIKCKSSGALTDKQQLLLEKRFGEQLIIDDHPTESENVQTSPISSTRGVLDPRAFVECGHMEIELFEDNFESPSYEALQRCHNLGVTYSELKLGIATNPRPNVQRFDLGNLYVSCRDVFNGNIDYITAELKDDYRRCKSVGAIDEEMQRVLEKKFLNSLYEKYGRAKKVEKKPSTTTSATSSSSVYETTSIVTTSISSNVSSSLGSSKRPDTNRYAFANCKRIENKAYIICIKVIKVYSTPIQYI